MKTEYFCILERNVPIPSIRKPADGAFEKLERCSNKSIEF